MIIHELIKNRRFVFNIALFFNCYFLVAQKEYFQQRVDYKMEVRLHDDRHALSAYTEINYVNNSSEELFYIYFHLWPNAAAPFWVRPPATGKHKKPNAVQGNCAG